MCDAQQQQQQQKNNDVRQVAYWYKSACFTGTKVQILTTRPSQQQQQQQEQNADVLLRKDAGSLRQEIAARMRRCSEHAGGIAASKTDAC